MAKSIDTSSFKTRHSKVDIAVFREVTEGEYSGIEHEVNNLIKKVYPGIVESLKVTTFKASLKVAEYAFQYASL